MHNLKQILSTGKKDSALGHFNISNIEALWAIFRAGQNIKAPILIGVSEGERAFIGAKQVVDLVRSLRQEFDYPIFLNADHTYTYEKVCEAVDLGYDAVIFDGAKLSLEENITQTKKCVDYARSKNPEIIIEGELGYIGSSSKMLEEIPEGASVSSETLTKIETAERFVKETGVDMLAPAVGNLHGMMKHGANPKLDIERIRQIKNALNIPLVLHGGSGISDDDFVGAIDAGIAIIHINTEIRLAFRKALVLSLQQNPDEIAPYKYMKAPMLAVRKVVEERLHLFNTLKNNVDNLSS
jgi:fructose-bisphosphate aldolase, class II